MTLSENPIARWNQAPTLSVVVPVMNEGVVLPHTYRRLIDVLGSVGEPFELVFIDDGSTDNTREVLSAIANTDGRVTVLELARNFGQEAALAAGLRYARGKAAVVIDADLQDPPEMIREMVDKWKHGYEVVYGVRTSRNEDTFLKRFFAVLFHRLFTSIADIRLPKNAGHFRLIDRRVIDVFNRLSEDPRNLRGLVPWIGFRQTSVSFAREARAAGESKYRVLKLIRIALDHITAFSSLPSLWISLTALALFGAGLATTVAFTGLALSGKLLVPVWGWIALGFFDLWTLQFGAIAILGEYVIRIHRNGLKRPLFVVDKVIQGKEEAKVINAGY